MIRKGFDHFLVRHSGLTLIFEDIAMLTMVEASGWLPLGKTYAGQYFDVEPQKDGCILLKPIAGIPEEEVWLHTPEMRAQLERGEAWMKAHSRVATDLDALAQRLGVK